MPVGLSHVPLSFVPPPPSTRDLGRHSALLPLLLMLRSNHKRHLPTLLLLGCVYFAIGDYAMSMNIDHEILVIDPKCVEAMCNIGRTLQALGRTSEAYQWWWTALQQQPSYWDVMDNVLGSALSTASRSVSDAGIYRQAQDMCRALLSPIVFPDGGFKVDISADHLHRLQKVYFASATLLHLLGEKDITIHVADLLTAMELVIRPPWPYPASDCYTFKDIIMTIFFISLFVFHDHSVTISQSILDALSPPQRQYSTQDVLHPSFDVLAAVHASEDRLLEATLAGGFETLPLVLLLPEQVMRLRQRLFLKSTGVLPSICSRTGDPDVFTPPSERTRDQTNAMTSTILLTLAKRLQECPPSTTIVSPSSGLSLHSDTSLVLLLYYLALSLYPTPSTFNNIGIVLSGISLSALQGGIQAEHQTATGFTLARAYYEHGLQLQPTHPHLLTNLGSLLKDQGQIEEAVGFYRSAVQYKPDFDVALANLGNALRDLGRPWEAIEYFERAVSVNPNLHEAICGLANARTALCSWHGRGRFGNEIGVDGDGMPIAPTDPSGPDHFGWMHEIVGITEAQMKANYTFNIDLVQYIGTIEDWLGWVEKARGFRPTGQDLARWTRCFQRFYSPFDRLEKNVNEGGFVVRFAEWVTRRLQNKWYKQSYGRIHRSETPSTPLPADNLAEYARLLLPPSLDMSTVPSVLPFHTFAYPMSARMIRMISHRNALRISHAVLTQPWLPQHVYRPPPPSFRGKLNVGYVSSDMCDHPLAHLMQSVFGLHGENSFSVYIYATNPPDGSASRQKIESESQRFLDVSSWTTQAVVERIVADQIHILVNLGGYTEGARNDIFAARPCPIQMSLMGFAGSVAAGWCDYLICDAIACPQNTCASELWRQRYRKGLETSRMQDEFMEIDLETDFDAVADPESTSENWSYVEKLVYMPHTFMATDHKQSCRDDEKLNPAERALVSSTVLWEDEEQRRCQWRDRVFPDLPKNTIIFANFNQTVFASWLRILARVPNSILWLLRFPAAGEDHVLRTARQWAGEKVAAQIRFCDVVPKAEHIARGRVADLVLDTIECSAHTVAADILWSGTPMLTWPKYHHKMCSRIGASMVHATGFGEQMTASSLLDYEERAVSFAQDISFASRVTNTGTVVELTHGKLVDLRKNLFLNRDRMPLFDTARWTQNLEKGYKEAWRRWAMGTEFEASTEWNECTGPEKDSGCIWVEDREPYLRVS
ncbi:glycosyl transferase family 41-domain-containing protein [Amylostereum chailletii]|nr:glycosyl transferase family 41-domain-containing protein [Amylostereum chailletii]